MHVRRHASAAEYLDVAGPALRTQPVINQLVIGVAQQVARDPGRYGADNYFFSVEDGGAIIGAALQTAPWPVQVSATSVEGARALARAFAAMPDPVAGVGGPDEAPGAFAAEYAALRGVTHRLADAMGTFELTAVTPLPAAPGARVIAGAEHVALVHAWLDAFHTETVPHDPPVRADAGERAVATGRAHLWLDEHGTPVAYAFNNRDIDGWASVGPVYTPPSARGRGYATSLVASVSQYLLDQGRPGCTLFTNLANPISNKIYERIGYRRVGSGFRYAFT
jgi:GNAT superfamily N-acetyltransferase